MNYEEMNNYKINRKVLWLTKGENRVTYKDPKSPDGVLCHGMQGVFDPCNNPSDAWPIIQQIWVTLMSSPYRGHGTLWDNTVVRYNCGKLRAAMICFLKMKDAEK